jgi:ATP-binding cassette subfamily C (CFTR/MRP) protein 4
MENFTAYWGLANEVGTMNVAPVLRGLNLQIERGRLYCIVGKIGSGKSSLLQSFLKEIPVFNGVFWS